MKRLVNLLFLILGGLWTLHNQLIMHRLNKSKDARRRARKQQQKAIHAYGVAITAARVIPDQREKLRKKAERNDER